MEKARIVENVDDFIELHILNEYSTNTIKQYKYCISVLLNYFEEHDDISKVDMLAYKKHLENTYGSSRSINKHIAVINKYLKWLSKDDKSNLELKDVRCDLCLKKIKTQLKSSNEDVLSIADYKRLLRKSKELGMMQIHMIMKVLAMTGIRISELQFFTYENIQKDKYYIRVFNKGKEREIILRQDLSRELRKYCRKHKIKNGYIFKGDVEGQMPDKSTIWRQMKKVAGIARVNKKKIHAHSFRHLFAQVYLNEYNGNATELADILGHSSLETTREYTRSSSLQKRQRLEKIKY